MIASERRYILLSHLRGALLVVGVILLAMFSVCMAYRDARNRQRLEYSAVAQDSVEDTPELPGPDIALWRLHPIARRKVLQERTQSPIPPCDF